MHSIQSSINNWLFICHIQPILLLFIYMYSKYHLSPRSLSIACVYEGGGGVGLFYFLELQIREIPAVLHGWVLKEFIYMLLYIYVTYTFYM